MKTFLHDGLELKNIFIQRKKSAKAKRLVLQCINGASSNPVEGRTKIWQLKNLIEIREGISDYTENGVLGMDEKYSILSPDMLYSFCSVTIMQ